MIDPIQELKTRAEILHKKIAAGDADAQARLRTLPGVAEVQRKHCLAIVAREVGFSTWEHALRVLRGEPGESDFGTALYGARTSATLNAWYIDHATAREHLDVARGRGEEAFLLAYKKQFFVTDRGFIEGLGLDPADPDWRAIGHDWAKPKEPSARTRLYAKRFDAMKSQA